MGAWRARAAYGFFCDRYYDLGLILVYRACGNEFTVLIKSDFNI